MACVVNLFVVGSYFFLVFFFYSLSWRRLLRLREATASNNRLIPVAVAVVVAVAVEVKVEFEVPVVRRFIVRRLLRFVCSCNQPSSRRSVVVSFACVWLFQRLRLVWSCHALSSLLLVVVIVLAAGALACCCCCCGC